MEALHAWLTAQLGRVSGKSSLAEAIRYALRHWSGLVLFLDDGWLELDTNVIERAIRPIASVHALATGRNARQRPEGRGIALSNGAIGARLGGDAAANDPGDATMQEESAEREAGRRYQRRSLVQGALAGLGGWQRRAFSPAPAHRRTPPPW